MRRQQLLAEVQIITEKLNDLDAKWFHYKYIKLLGFQRCYELASYALQLYREGKISVNPASFYNGCVRREVDQRKEKHAAE